MESLWPKFENSIIEENNSIKILRSQAKAIKAETDGSVNATFSKMNYRSGPASTIKAFGQMMSSMSSPLYEEILDDELKDKADVNKLYAITKYKFEIYNSEYRFRLFILNYREMFPVSLNVDEGILEDITYKNEDPITSNNELENTLKSIFSSSKVRAVVTKMLQNNKSKEQIDDSSLPRSI